MKIRSILAMGLIAAANSIFAGGSENIAKSWNWNNKDMDGWAVHSDKKDIVGISAVSRTEKDTCLEIDVPGGWCPSIVCKDQFIDGVKKISLEINPGSGFGWIKVQPVLQSSVKEWDPCKEEELTPGDKWHTLTFDLDSDKHKGATWNQVVIIVNSDKKGKVRIDNVKLLK